MLATTVDVPHLVTAPDKRPTGNVKEAHVLCDLLPLIEFRGFDISVHLHMLLGWAHVLAERDDIDLSFAEFWKRAGQIHRVRCLSYHLPLSASTTWSSDSPTPSMILVLVTFTPASFAHCNTRKLCRKLARRSRTNGVSASTVSMLCA